jgi:hypothetical protein
MRELASARPAVSVRRTVSLAGGPVVVKPMTKVWAEHDADHQTSTQKKLGFLAPTAGEGSPERRRNLR